MQIPIRVRWAGWESDTYRLKREGWKVWAGERISQYEFAKELEIALTCPEDKLMIHGKLKINPRDLYARGSQVEMQKLLYQIGVDMHMYRPTDRFMTYEKPKVFWDDLNSLSESDGFASIPLEEHRLHDLKIFQNTDKPKEIYLPPSSVDECLNQILRLQYPQQQEIKAKEKEIIRPVMQARVYALAA